MHNTLLTGPTVEPVSLADAKSFLRIEHDDEDTFIGELIEASRSYFEMKTQLALLSQTWRLTFDQIPTKPSKDDWWDGWREGAIASLTEPRRAIELPTAPLISVTQFLAYAEDDSSVEFTDFYPDTNSRPGRIALRNNGIWPTATRGVANYQIDYVAGFGAAASNVPVDIRVALKQIIAHWYENREILSFDAAGRDVPMTALNIISSRRIRNL